MGNGVLTENTMRERQTENTMRQRLSTTGYAKNKRTPQFRRLLGRGCPHASPTFLIVQRRASSGDGTGDERVPPPDLEDRRAGTPNTVKKKQAKVVAVLSVRKLHGIATRAKCILTRFRAREALWTLLIFSTRYERLEK